jgi:hypothetical protein
MSEVANVGVLGLELQPGDHLCAFYRKPAERDEFIVPFLIDGLLSGHKCVCVVDSCTPADVLDQLAAQLADVDSYLERAQLEVLGSSATYLRSGGFLPQQMLSFWETKARTATEDGTYSFIRNVGDMSWVHSGRPGVAELASYESQLNRFIPRYPQVNLCLYDISRCAGEVVLDVLKTHPKVLLGKMVLRNPFYLEPEEFLATRGFAGAGLDA